MIELTLRVSLDHPLVLFTRRHASARANIQCEEGREGAFTQEIVQASRSILQDYAKKLAEPAANDGCGRQATVEEKLNQLVIMTGPCNCGGSRASCAPLESLRACVAKLLPGRVRLVELAIERGKVLAHVRYFEDELPSALHGDAPLAASEKAAVLGVASAVRVLPQPEGGFLAGRLEDTESETLRIAQRMGYYEKPRRATMDDLARELGITKSAVCHRLNKLEQKAIRRMMSTQGGGEQLALVTTHGDGRWPRIGLPAR